MSNSRPSEEIKDLLANKLEKIDIAFLKYNEFASQIMDALPENTSLKIVNCDASETLNNHLDKFIQFLSNNPNLEKLSIKRNLGSVISLKPIFDALAKNTGLKLKQLDITIRLDNEFDDEAVHSLINFLRNAPALVELRIAYCHLSDQAIAEIVNALSANPNISELQTLDLASNRIGVSGSKAIAALLNNKHCRLSELLLSDNDKMGAGINYIARAVAINKHLTTLCLSDTILPDADAVKSMAIMIAANSSLRFLNLTNVFLQDGDGALLLNAVPADTALETIYMQDCRDPSYHATSLIGAETLEALGLLLKRNATLKVIKAFPANGEKYLANFTDGIAANRTLQELHLSYSVTDELYCIKLLEAVKENKSIRLLDLTGCTIGDIATEKLVDVLLDPSTRIKDLSLFRAIMSAENVRKIEEAALKTGVTCELYGISSQPSKYNSDLARKQNPRLSDAPASVLYPPANLAPKVDSPAPHSLRK